MIKELLLGSYINNSRSLIALIAALLFNYLNFEQHNTLYYIILINFDFWYQN